MVRNDVRSSHVKSLRDLARTAKVEEVRSNEASRAQVLSMVVSDGVLLGWRVTAKLQTKSIIDPVIILAFLV